MAKSVPEALGCFRYILTSYVKGSLLLFQKGTKLSPATLLPWLRQSATLDLALLHKRVNCWPHRTLLSAADGSALDSIEEKSAMHISEDWVTGGMRWLWRALNCILVSVGCVGCWGG